jgi:hypothetical protein
MRLHAYLKMLLQVPKTLGEGPVVLMQTRGANIRRAHHAVHSILAGVVRPRAIVLVVQGEPSLQLEALEHDNLLEISCPISDYGPHSVWYAPVRHMENPFVIAADDVLYDSQWLARLCACAASYPDCMVCGGAAFMEGEYPRAWKYTHAFDGPSHMLFPLHRAGVYCNAKVLRAMHHTPAPDLMITCRTSLDVHLKYMALSTLSKIVLPKGSPASLLEIPDTTPMYQDHDACFTKHIPRSWLELENAIKG